MKNINISSLKKYVSLYFCLKTWRKVEKVVEVRTFTSFQIDEPYNAIPRESI